MNESIKRIYELQVKLAQESLNALKSLQAHAAGAEASLDRLGKMAKSFGKGLLGGLSIGYVFTQVTGAIFGAIDAIDQLDKSATRLKMPIEEFAQLKYAAFQTDVEIGELEAGMKFLQKALSDFQNEGAETTKVLRALGVNPSGKSMSEVLIEIAGAMEKVTDASLKTRAELVLFGRGGLAMSTLLQKGSAGLRELMEESKRLNNVTSESGRLQADYEEQLKRMQEASAGLTRSFAEGLLPGLTGVLRAFNESPKALEAFNTAGKVVAWIIRDIAIRAHNLALGVEFFGKVMLRLREASDALVHLDFAKATAAIGGIGAAWEETSQKQADFKRTLEDMKPAIDESVENAGVGAGANKRLAAALADKNKEQEKAARLAEQELNTFNRRLAQLDDMLVKLRDASDAESEVAKIMRETARGTLIVTAAHKERLLVLAKEIDLLRAAAEAEKGWVLGIDQVIEARRAAGEVGESNIQRLERLTSGTNVVEIKRLRAEIEELNKELFDTDDVDTLGSLTERLTKAQDRLRELAAGPKKELEGLGKLMDDLANRADGYGKDLAGLFVDFATGAGDAKASFSDFAVSFLRQLAQMTVQTLIFDEVIKTVRASMQGWAAAQGASSVNAMVGPAMGSAGMGAAFDRGNVLPFARGGVVTRPTLFAMAGGAGLMGEAGPEAVLPLHRGADGSLGVRGGSTVNVSVVNNASGARARSEEDTQPDGTVNVRIMIEDVVDKALTRGRFDTSMAQSFGNTRRGRM